MLLQKTGLRIRQLISHRSNKRSDSSDENIQDITTPEGKQAGSTPRRLSRRLSHNSSFDFPLLQRTNSASTSKSRQLSSTNESISSSTSSLCSCGCEANSSSSGYSLSKPVPTTDPSGILYLPRLSPSSTTEDPKTWGRIFSDTASRSRASSVSKHGTDPVSPDSTSRLSRFDPLETLSIAPVDKDKTPTQSLRGNEDIEMDSFLKDVDQLIKDTDGALRAVETTLADAKVATKFWYDTTPTEPGPVVTLETTLQRSSTIERGVSRKPPRSQIFTVQTASSRHSSPFSGDRSKKSIKKNKRPGFFVRNPRIIHPALPQALSKWDLTGVTTNMVDVFEAMFRPVEVYEILAPVRLQQLRQDNVPENQLRVSSESTRDSDTILSDTPTESFHIEHLSARIDAANKRITPPEPLLPPPPIPFPNKQPRIDFTEPDTSYEIMRIDDLQFPIPPPQLPAPQDLTRLPQSKPRSRTKSPTILLPTIPELSPFYISPTQFPYDSPRSTSPPIHTQTPLPLNDKLNLNLASTLYTQTSPLFLHGAIRISHSLLEARRLEKKCSPLHSMWEETEPLDWTAFQMAILGNSLPEDYDDDSDENIIDWWESFAIGGPGTLVREWEQEEDSETESLASSGIWDTGKSIGEIYDDAKDLREQHLDNNKGLQRHNRYHELPDNETKPLLPTRSPLRQRKPIPLDLNISSRLLSLGSMPDTPASLPPSPMFDLVGGVGGKEDVSVPMAFNLGHDLGDYLSWKTWNVPVNKNGA